MKGYNAPRLCANCRVPLLWGVVCFDCMKMVIATVVAELVAAGVFWAIRVLRGL